MNFIYDGKDDFEYEHINKTIIYCNLTDMPLVICKIKFGAIYADDTPYHSYYIIIFTLYPYILQEDFNIYMDK